MQPLNWYVQRLRSMSAGELVWRLKSTLRDTVDRPRIALQMYPSRSSWGGAIPSADYLPGFEVSDVEYASWDAADMSPIEHEWYARLRKRAEMLLDHRLSFFHLENQHVGSPIDWNRDHESGMPTPFCFAQGIDYRDYQVTGDAKVVWEPNRHHHLVVLARAYRASGDRRYAAAVVEQLQSWLEQCPFGRGMNWRSPLELAVRLINWVWAIDLIRQSGALTPSFRHDFLESVYLHLWDITRKYSRGSSANNHLIGEAAGVFIASSYFPFFDPKGSLRESSALILSREILEQSYVDGGGREQAFGYQVFVLQFFLLAGLVAQRTGREFPKTYWMRVERMLEFVGAITQGGGSTSLFGDYDDGYVLDLGNGPGDARGLLAVGAVLFNRPDFKAWAGGYQETAHWLLGPTAKAAFGDLPTPRTSATLVSRAFPKSGYYLLQAGSTGGQAPAISVLFDCGELGYKSLAAHGHADALSFTLRISGRDVFVDPGTYDYFRFPEWRTYFRSTRAHNTVVVDNCDQSEMLGPFLWGARAAARCVQWQRAADGGTVTGEHDGYRRLPDPVLHRRTIDLHGQAGTVRIRDEIVAGSRHAVSLVFHLAESCRISSVDGRRFVITTGQDTLLLTVDPRLSVNVLAGSEEPIAGWVSHGYHRKVPTITLIASGDSEGTTVFECFIVVNSADEDR
ncbi:MAG: alginate lyase family protein [Candidatus Binatia bacterium]